MWHKESEFGECEIMGDILGNDKSITYLGNDERYFQKTDLCYCESLNVAGGIRERSGNTAGGKLHATR